MKMPIHLNYETLPEAHSWNVGKNYRVKLVLRQTGSSENGADFEVVDATSLEDSDKGHRFFLSEGGSYKA